MFISRALFKITVVWRLLQTMYLRGGTGNCAFLYGCSNIEPSSFIVRSFIYQPTSLPSLPPLTTGCYHKNLHVSNLYTIIHPWMVAGNQLHSYRGAETLLYFFSIGPILWFGVCALESKENPYLCIMFFEMSVPPPSTYANGLQFIPTRDTYIFMNGLLF